jgi:hypothetical protein
VWSGSVPMGIWAKMIEMIKELDGKVDCFGLGGMDLYAYAGEKRYLIGMPPRWPGRQQKPPWWTDPV